MVAVVVLMLMLMLMVLVLLVAELLRPVLLLLTMDVTQQLLPVVVLPMLLRAARVATYLPLLPLRVLDWTPLGDRSPSRGRGPRDRATGRRGRRGSSRPAPAPPHGRTERAGTATTSTRPSWRRSRRRKMVRRRPLRGPGGRTWQKAPPWSSMQPPTRSWKPPMPLRARSSKRRASSESTVGEEQQQRGAAGVAMSME